MPVYLDGPKCWHQMTIGFEWFWASGKAEQLALGSPTEWNIADAQDPATCQINRLRAIDNRGDNIRC